MRRPGTHGLASNHLIASARKNGRQDEAHWDTCFIAADSGLSRHLRLVGFVGAQQDLDSQIDAVRYKWARYDCRWSTP